MFIENDEKVTDHVQVSFLRDKEKSEKGLLDRALGVINMIPGMDFIVTFFSLDKKRTGYPIYLVDGQILRSNIALLKSTAYMNFEEMGRRPYGVKTSDINKVTFIYNGPVLFMSEMVVHQLIDGKKSKVRLPLMGLGDITRCKQLCVKHNILYGQRPGLRFVILWAVILAIGITIIQS